MMLIRRSKRSLMHLLLKPKQPRPLVNLNYLVKRPLRIVAHIKYSQKLKEVGIYIKVKMEGVYDLITLVS